MRDKESFRMYIPRHIDEVLIRWKNADTHKPLLVRGARQVGKSTAVRQLGHFFKYTLEVNFEAQKSVHNLFKGDIDPAVICENLAAIYNTPIKPGETLLFFDEIQACPEAISALRFFYEKMPSLHVVAAGSLLEFALGELPSFGVGRISSVYMYPLSFDEYLTAVGEEGLVNIKSKARPGSPISDAVHSKLLMHLRKFLLLGGMPEVISHYIISGGDLIGCRQILADMSVSFKDDFSKYRKRVPELRIAEVFDSVVAQTGKKFVYSSAATESNHKQIKEALQLLTMAGLVIPVTHTAANGIPLGAEVNPKRQKMLILDTGLLLYFLNTPLDEILLGDEFEFINRGPLAELHVGLELIKSQSTSDGAHLYYWQREERNSQAEVDYVVQVKDNVCPIEVKAGRKGSMQSINLFMNEKGSGLGVRFSAEANSRISMIEIWPLYAVRQFMQLNQNKTAASQ